MFCCVNKNNIMRINQNLKNTIVLIAAVLISYSAFNQSRVDDAVDFTIPDTQGNEYNLFEQFDDGKVVVLYFFSPYCGSCYYDAPILDSVYQHYGGEDGDVIVWGIAYPYATHQKIDSFKNTTGISYPCLSTNMTEPVFYYYNVGYTPQTIVTCHYMSSGSIAYAHLEYYIEGCFGNFPTNIQKQIAPANIQIENNSIIVNNNLQEKISVQIVDVRGRILKQKTCKPGEEIVINSLNLFQLYIINIISESGDIQVEKLLLIE